MARTYTIRCIGRRHIEVSKALDGKILIKLKWLETKTLCGLWFEPEEAKKLKKAMNDFAVD